MSVFTISDVTLKPRVRNILWGAGLSLVLIAVITFGHVRYPETYNDVLLWSVVGFVLIANLVNVFRYRRYIRLIRDHRVELHSGQVQFWTNGEKSELALSDVAVMNLFRRRDRLRHIQLRLKNNRGIRLEGYDDMDRLATALREQIPAAQVVDRKI